MKQSIVGGVTVERSEVRVFDETSRRTVWKRTFSNPSIAWSSDRRTIGIIDGDFWTTWMAGDKVRQVRLKGQLCGETEYQASMRWSPDNARLLVIGPMTQGDMILEVGRLVVLTANSANIQHVGYSVNNASWIDGRRLRFERWNFNENGKTSETKTISVR